MRWVKILFTWLFLLLLLAMSLGLLYAIFGEVEAAARATIFVEASKVLLQFIIVVVLGSMATMAFKSFDRRRRGDRALQEFRQEFLDSLTKCYQDAKRVRRNLRAEGLTMRFGASEPELTRKRRDAYREQIAFLNDAQLALESLMTQAAHFPDAFSTKDTIYKELHAMNGYLRSVVKEYEEHWPELSKELPGVKYDALPCLRDFTGPFETANFSSSFSSHYYTAIKLVRQDLLPIHAVESL